MFKVTVTLTYGTGGYKYNPHRYWSGTGVAMCHSPKAATHLATERANRICGEGSAWCLVYRDVVIERIR